MSLLNKLMRIAIKDLFSHTVGVGENTIRTVTPLSLLDGTLHHEKHLPQLDVNYPAQTRGF